MSYQKAKEEELNLGLDLQGGMNVTLEVEMTGLLNTLSNNSKDPVFLKAIANAEKRKANSSANFVTLFAEEYKQLSNDGQLAGLFAANSAGKITFRSTNSQVIKYLNDQTGEAFQSTYNILTKRIDQFGVAQPNINKEADRGIITVELPGVKDRERVKRLLQSSANLQFWDAYKFEDIKGSLDQAEAAFDNYIKGITPDTAKVDTTGKNGLATDTSGNKVDTNMVVKFGTDTAKPGAPKSTTPTAAQQPKNAAKRSLGEYLSGDPAGNTLGYVRKDTGALKEYLNSPALKKFFPPDAWFVYGQPNKDNKNLIPLYVLRTYGRETPQLEGDVIKDARQAFDPIKGPIVEMEMNAIGANKWGTITEKSAKEKTPIAIVLDEGETVGEEMPKPAAAANLTSSVRSR
jgi:SecD/SecF fusion protein